jgi:branched-chain amino acid transport system permease protein
MVLTTVLLSEITKAWLLYLGLAFMLVVLVAPGGIGGVLQWHGRVLRAGIWQRLWPAYAGMLVCAGVAFTGFAAAVEMLYARQLDSGAGTTLSFWGLALDSASPWSWVACVTLLVLGGVPFRFLLRRFQAELAASQPAVAGTQLSGLRPTGGRH